MLRQTTKTKVDDRRRRDVPPLGECDVVDGKDVDGDTEGKTSGKVNFADHR